MSAVNWMIWILGAIAAVYVLIGIGFWLWSGKFIAGAMWPLTVLWVIFGNIQ